MEYDITLKNQANIAFSFCFSPVKNVRYNISELLGNFSSELIRNFYSKILANRVNVIISELVKNVIENIVDNSSFIEICLEINTEILIVKVKNKVNMDDYVKVKDHIKHINRIKNTGKLLARTINERRAKGLKGGLGFIRLKFEQKCVLSVRYNRSNSYMTTQAKINL
jgi:hypothetical protein